MAQKVILVIVAAFLGGCVSGAPKQTQNSTVQTAVQPGAESDSKIIERRVNPTVKDF